MLFQIIYDDFYFRVGGGLGASHGYTEAALEGDRDATGKLRVVLVFGGRERQRRDHGGKMDAVGAHRYRRVGGSGRV